MNKITKSVAISLLVCLGLSACSGSSDTAEPEGESGTAGTPDVVIGEDGELPEAEVTSLTIGISDLDPGTAPIFTAYDGGVFKENGLDVELLIFEGGGQAAQALAAGQVDLAVFSGGPVLSSLGTDRPFVSVGTFSGSINNLWVGPPDSSVDDDITGKSVAISQYGAVSHVASLVALREMGYDPQDVRFAQVGGASARMAAVIGGTVVGAPVLLGQRSEVEEAGLEVLIDLTKLGGDKAVAASSCINFLRSFADENPATVLRVFASLYQGLQLIDDDPELAAESYAEWAGLTVEEAAVQVTEHAPQFNREMRLSPGMFENTRDALTFVDPDMADIDVEKAFNMSFHDQLVDAGIIEVSE